MRNFRMAMARLAPHLENANFFVLSTGDGLDRWVDEYRIEAGVVSADRRDDAHFREFVKFCRKRRNRK